MEFELHRVTPGEPGSEPADAVIATAKLVDGAAVVTTDNEATMATLSRPFILDRKYSLSDGRAWMLAMRARMSNSSFTYVRLTENGQDVPANEHY